jgi:hypothetical protein
MKLAKIVIGVALAAGIAASPLLIDKAGGQNLTPVPSGPITCATVLPTQEAQSILSNASIQNGTIRVVGTNVWIEGRARIIVPLSQIGSLANISTCTGAYTTNLTGGTFTQVTNGWAVTVSFNPAH